MDTATRRADGSVTTIASLAARGKRLTVFNLEVDAEHVYHVGTGGVLVHNTYITYTATDRVTGLTYVGRASGTGAPRDILARRLSSHHRDLDISTAKIDRVTDSYEAIRGREQHMIDSLRSGPGAANTINGISARNRRLNDYLNAASWAFGMP